ncbi:MAG: AbrB/MazE/SpoVT family DNA-binding domain-containing protein, partial [Verrucomicrobia bacterium]|nr:AbrB/MazE/SpoVT family DNA-binding domain-containing protein [Leptolyngbya sp. ES-bin-22]
MTKATVSADGQTMIPKEVLDFLKLQAGDEIDFIMEENGKVI